jgi:electron transport complex protein RnfG
VGVAIHSFWQGWSGDDIQVMVGFDTEGNIYNYSVLHHTETPGLGDVMEPFFREYGNPRRNIIGRNPGEGLLRLVNDGGDIDAMTAATITARAFLNAVNKAYAAFRDGYVDLTPSRPPVDLKSGLIVVLPEFDNNPAAESFRPQFQFTDLPVIFPATRRGEPVGFAVHTYTNNGRNGQMQVMVGFDTEGNITGYYVLHHIETPDFVVGMDRWFKDDAYPGRNIIGRNIAQGLLILEDDGGDVDAVTGSTRTARAILEAVNKAHSALHNEPIDLESAIRAIFPDFDNDPIAEVREVFLVGGNSLYEFPVWRDNEWLGLAIHTFTENGFGGNIHLMVGFDTKNNIIDYYIMYHNETPRWVEGMETWFSEEAYPQRSIIGRNLWQGLLALTDDGGDIDIDGATRATVTARAMLEAINRAMMAFQPIKEGEPSID